MLWGNPSAHGPAQQGLFFRPNTCLQNGLKAKGIFATIRTSLQTAGARFCGAPLFAGSCSCLASKNQNIYSCLGCGQFLSGQQLVQIGPQTGRRRPFLTRGCHARMPLKRSKLGALDGGPVLKPSVQIGLKTACLCRRANTGERVWQMATHLQDVECKLCPL